MRWPRIAAAFVVLLPAGCVVRSTEFNALKAQNASLVDRNRAQQDMIESLRAHCRLTEDQLIRAERDLASYRLRLGEEPAALAAGGANSPNSGWRPLAESGYR